MPNGYGVTEKGLVVKRLDRILDELHDDLSAGWGVNTRLNPKSYLNVLLTDFADKIAELWEFGGEIYNSMYPSSAEGISLDNAAQFGGSTRAAAAKTYYPIHCTGVDGTVVPAGTMIRSNTNPSISFVSSETKELSRQSFNKAWIRVLTVQAGSVYTIALNGALFSVNGAAGFTESTILAGLAEAIKCEDFTAKVVENLLFIEAVNLQSSNVLILTENLTTERVTSIINFASEDYGEIILPDGVITEIVKSVPGLTECCNLSGYIAGRLRETDTEFRRSYANKIFARSLRMLDSIKSAVLQNVQGVRSVAAFENDSNETDSAGRPPHSIEIIVDGGADQKIAEQILAQKAGGITTYGNVVVDVPGEEGENIPVRFNRPAYVYVWFKVIVTIGDDEELPINYVELIKDTIIGQMNNIGAGQKVMPQKFIAGIYANVAGIDYVDIDAFSSTDLAEVPDNYTEKIVSINPRQRAVTDKTRIEVVIDA